MDLELNQLHWKLEVFFYYSPAVCTNKIWIQLVNILKVRFLNCKHYWGLYFIPETLNYVPVFYVKIIQRKTAFKKIVCPDFLYIVHNLRLLSLQTLNSYL